eukprot:1178337-Karenia_brevis.AAC.1
MPKPAIHRRIPKCSRKSAGMLARTVRRYLTMGLLQSPSSTMDLSLTAQLVPMPLRRSKRGWKRNFGCRKGSQRPLLRPCQRSC